MQRADESKEEHDPFKIKQKTQCKDNLECRFYKVHQESQKHVLKECERNPHIINSPYEELISDENCERLKAAEKIIITVETLKKT